MQPCSFSDSIDLKEVVIPIMDSRSTITESTGPSLASALRYAIQALFLLIIVVPVVVASIYVTRIGELGGRAGLLLPALLLAGDLERKLLWLGFCGVGCALLIAMIVGLLIGFIGLSQRTKIGRFTAWLAILPSHGPVWVLPLIWAISLDEILGFEFASNWIVPAWVWWTGWWGASRIACVVKREAVKASQDEWESARLLGASVWTAFRLVIKPRIQNKVGKELNLVAAVCLFDPTPFLIWGEVNWPISRMVQSLLQQNGLGVSLAATWAMFMALLLAAWVGLIYLLTGDRLKNESLLDPVSSGRFRPIRFAIPFSPLILIAIWPLGFMAVTIGLVMKPEMFSVEFLGVMLYESRRANLAQMAWLGGVFGASIMAVVTKLLVRQSGFPVTINKTVCNLCGWWPLGFAVCALVVLEQFAQSPASNWFSIILRQPLVAILVWVLILLVYSLAGVSQITNEGQSKQESESESASSEAAFFYGASVWKARKLALRPGSRSKDWVWMAALFNAFWWVWASPVWAILGLISQSPWPMWGGILGRSTNIGLGNQIGLWLMTVLPVVVVTHLVGLISRKSRAD